jgi:hypothetical protein
MMLSPLNTPRAKQIKPETRNGGISFSKPTPLPDFIMEPGILERSSVIKQSFSRKKLARWDASTLPALASYLCHWLLNHPDPSFPSPVAVQQDSH